MNFREITEKRISCRSYSKKKIEENVMQYVMECTRLAPSAMNKQPWEILLVESEEMRIRLGDSYSGSWLVHAPMIAVFIGLKGTNWTRRYDGADYLLCDVTIAATHFVLAAEEKGLGTCYIAAFDPSKVFQALNLTEEKEPLLMISVGYPAGELKSEHKRKDLDDIFRRV